MDVLIVFIVFSMLTLLGYYIYKRIKYQLAKNEIKEFVLSYVRRCTDNNRFVVTPVTLQDSFREYDSHIIDKVWCDLVNEHVIEADPMDGEWCIRKGGSI